MNPELRERAEALWEADRKFVNYPDDPPDSEGARIYEGMMRLAEEIPQRDTATSLEEFHEGEIRRKLNARTVVLRNYLRGKGYTLNDVITMYQLDPDDLDQLEPWLRKNKAKALDINKQLYKKAEPQDYQNQLPLDIPALKQTIEGHAAVHFANINEALRPLLAKQTKAAEHLRTIDVVPTTEGRSYFHLHTRRLALSIPGSFYETSNGQIHPRDRQVLRLFGHEGAHALQRVITAEADNPFFLSEPSSSTSSTNESIAQHFEHVIFDDLENSPETQWQLRIQDIYPDIYQEQKDRRFLLEYQKRFFYYAVKTMSDESIGPLTEPENARPLIERIGELSLHAYKAKAIVEQNKYNYDIDGNLNRELAYELRYASQPVGRSLAIFEESGITYDNPEGRTRIDYTFLNGYHTPKGLEQRVALVAQGKIEPFVKKR